MEKIKATPGALSISIEKNDTGDGYTGWMEFENTEVLIEAMAVMTQRAATLLGVPPVFVNVKVGEVLYKAEGGEADG